MAERIILVKFVGDAKRDYLALRAAVEKESTSGVASSFHKTLLTAIDTKVILLKQSPDYGVHIPRRLVPIKYSHEYGVTNLWKVDLPGYWRMIYTIRQPQRGNSQVEVLEILLDILDVIGHKEYDHIFGYRKR